MRRRIEQLINGRFEYEVPALKTSVEEIFIRIPEGRNRKGEFSIGTEDGSRVKGFVTSDNRRIVLAKEKFIGSTSQIVYGIDTQGLVCDDEIQGNIVISSNIGEKLIPVHVQIAKTPVKSSRGAIDTLESFTALAMKDSRDAFRLFTGEQFQQLLAGRGEKLRSLYKGMSHNPVTYQHMEEFLVACGQKSQIRLSLEGETQKNYQLSSSLKDTLSIHRSTWGYVRMEIEVVGDFLEVEKRVVTTDDFIGSVYRLEYVVRREALGKGKHYGKILIRNVHQTLEFQISASADRGERLSPKGLKRQKTVELLQDYLSLQLHRMDYRTWFDRSMENFRELTQAECMDPMLVLFEAYVYYLNENNTQTIELLWNFKTGGMPVNTPAEHGLYRYLAKKVDLLPPEKRQILPKIKAYLQQKPDDYCLLWILMQEDETCRDIPIQQLHLMEQSFERGCRSPFLYLSALQLLERQEGLLRKLSPFMIQVLNFARKQGVLGESLLKRAAYLSDNLKECNQAVYRMLEKGYGAYPSDEVLEAICKLIMKGTPSKKEYFRWYSLAVEWEIRITRLYEYYIETMSMESRQALPQVIRMYFSYNNTLSAGKKAFIYANVIRNKETDKVTYASYRKAMEAFALQQLKKGRMNSDYAALYQEMIRKVEDKETARALGEVLFTYRLEVENRSIRSVVVCHGALEREAVYPVTDQCAYIQIYSPDAAVFLEDEKRRRYGVTVEYRLEKLMEEGELAGQCARFAPEHPGMLLYLCGSSPDQMQVTGENLELYQKASEMTEFTGEYRSWLRRSLLDYDLQHPGEKQVERYLRTVDVQEYAKVDRADTVEVLTAQGMYEEAFAIVTRWGVEGIDDLILMKLAGRMILAREFQADEELVYLAAHVFARGKYDEIILSYLRDHYVGTVECMCGLWEKVKGFQLESYRLDEKILMYAMYVRQFPPQGERVLESYIMQQGRELVIQAYLTYAACAYFMADQKTEPALFGYLERVTARGWEMDIICRLALLKFYSGCETLQEEQEQMAARLLREFDQRGLRFAFFRKLPPALIQAYQVEDKVFVEERFRPGSKVTIHYAMHPGEKEPEGFKSEPMRDMYQGIYNKEFLLFYGEKLTYYLTVERDKEKYTLPRKEVALGEVEPGGRTRYKLLNQILAARAVGNDEETKRALRFYLEQEKFVDTAFTIMG